MTYAHYAHYAHRGAYPLVATALLAAIFVLLAFRTNGPAHTSRTARWLVYVWLGQNVFLTFSAVWRLHLYVGAYSLTRLRLAAGIWMGLVAIGLVLIIRRIRLRKSNAWLVRANLACLLSALFVCSFLNLDGFIANWNVDARLRGTTLVPIDLEYIGGLGPAALPALERLEREAPDLAPAAHAAAVPLVRRLRAQAGNWRGWTWRRQRLRDAFAEFRVNQIGMTPNGREIKPDKGENHGWY